MHEFLFLGFPIKTVLTICIAPIAHISITRRPRDFWVASTNSRRIAVWFKVSGYFIYGRARRDIEVVGRVGFCILLNLGLIIVAPGSG
ncbi:uncharacterized protein F4822DRAFT_181661 [Hypoxylon trugodes]|uniref:uncharacterized protein n=1 Tax=Hypoxylon trugodes TaxID=326681 RepID=UPI002198EFDC|nr:uncharacterized protein F4822DRAFT_181661 [Hypoxylon trugodes]KAI1391323.1 hypothetical protein F4822DRAFT_181661 [Hypoxylon trugodes]